MKKLIEALLNDKELVELKKEYKLITGKNAPPYHYDNFNGIEAYKSYIRESIADYKIKNT